LLWGTHFYWWWQDLSDDAEKLQLVLDDYINLVQRVKGCMILLNVSATGEEDYIEENESRGMKDLEYRKKQLKQLQTKVVDLEEISGGISITDVTFNDFKIILRQNNLKVQYYLL